MLHWTSLWQLLNLAILNGLIVLAVRSRKGPEKNTSAAESPIHTKKPRMSGAF